MPEILDLPDFLQGKRLTPVALGKSGAQVSFVDDEYVWKFAERTDMPQPEAWDGCVREARMYDAFREKNVEFAPEALHIERTRQHVSLVLRRGRMLRKAEVDAQLLDRITDLLIKVHHFPPPEFLEKPHGFLPPDSRTIDSWLAGWECVLAEHPGVFSPRDAQLVARYYIQVNQAMENGAQGLVHGDFHVENLLILPDGRLAACDWQSACVGNPAGDLSFLHSRLCADGIEVDEDALVRAYCASAARAGYSADAQLISRAIALANVNTSFAFWHEYLHGADTARVAAVFEKMVGDMRRLLA